MNRPYILTLLLLVVLIFIFANIGVPGETQSNIEFDEERAFQHVVAQVDFGARYPGSPGHTAVAQWITLQLQGTGWQVSYQDVVFEGTPVHNIIAKRGQGDADIILGAHYDTRKFADRDPNEARQVLPVPGANDGASGVAVLLELARILPQDLPHNIWLVFFDAEDNGRIEGQDWIIGSRAFAGQMDFMPQAVIIVDMVGDADLQLYYEVSSDDAIKQELWEIAADLGYGEQFIQREKHNILDDHTPFLQLGIPAVDIIDFDYRYWHTTMDLPEHVSPESLKAVGDTLYTWLSDQ